MAIDPNTLAQYGILGVIVAWFMFRNEKRLEKVADKLEQFTESSNKVVEAINRLINKLDKD